ncbi:MAG: hypothetical protein HQK79_00535 [Desulfobacterales bacterium]|nr:hypothetical protein [Desulfobacterales bacterium]
MIVQMKKIMLAGRQADRTAILSLLREASVLHIEPINPELVFVSPELLKDINRAEKAIEVLEKLKPNDSKNLEKSKAVPNLIERVESIVNEQIKLETDKNEIDKEIEKVKYWGKIDFEDLEFLRASGLHIEFFLCPQGKEEDLSAEVIQTIFTKDGISYVVAASRKQIQFADFIKKVPEPSKDVNQLKKDLELVKNHEIEISEELLNISKHFHEILSYKDELLAKKRFIEAEKSSIEEGPIFVLKGWVPIDYVSDLEKALKESKFSLGYKIDDPEIDDAPPTKLKNSWWIKPIECLYNLLGIIPGYREVDISMFFLPFLTIFTAMLIADAGYGFIIILILLATYKNLTAKGLPKEVLQLFIILFGGTLIYGILTNSYFGTSFIKLTDFDAGSPEGETFLKKLCFFIGAFHISIAHIWKIKQNPIGMSSLAEVGWILFAWSMYALINVLVIGEPKPFWMIPLFEISLVMILLFTSPSWNIIMAVLKGLGAIALNAAAFLSDIISYIRLWAVGLAGGILAVSFNQLAKPLPIIFALIVLILAHLMNLALGLVAIFAHGVRLNLLEFSNHIGMEWTGREYDPFKK